MRTASVKAIALSAVYRANLSFNRHVPFPTFAHARYAGFAHARTPRALHSLLCIHYPAAAHAQSGLFCQSSKNIEIRPLRTVYGFKEHWNKRKTYSLLFLGAGFVHMALSRE